MCNNQSVYTDHSPHLLGQRRGSSDQITSDFVCSNDLKSQVLLHFIAGRVQSPSYRLAQLRKQQYRSRSKKCEGYSHGSSATQLCASNVHLSFKVGQVSSSSARHNINFRYGNAFMLQSPLYWYSLSNTDVKSGYSLCNSDY